MSNTRRFIQAFLLLTVSAGVGCSTVPDSGFERDQLKDRTQHTVAEFKRADPSLTDNFFETAEGWAVFPAIGKGGVGVGGARGRGVLYEGGKPVGFCSLTQATIGFQLGGQSYSEIIFFRTEDALARFKKGNMELSAQMSAVALEAGAGAQAEYEGGVAVFIRGEKGLMYEASVGGQKFDYVSWNSAN